MNKSVHLAVLAGALLTQGTHARVIYGEDHRVEVSNGTPFQQSLAASAATMISENKMKRDPAKPGVVQLDQQTLKQWMEDQLSVQQKNKELVGGNKLITPIKQAAEAGVLGFCEDVKFSEQPNPGMCSGFLIAPDLLITAGHCAELETFCSEYKWVFGFQVNPETKSAGLEVKEQDIYKCKKVISNTLSVSLGLDYALVQLDRPVTDRQPLEIRNDSQVSVGTPLLVIGSPSGLPLKIAGGAKVRTSEHPSYFTANLDTFQGNSGSAVFNAVTGVVEGILVRGESDFGFDQTKMCVSSTLCKDDECRGEDVSRLTSIPEIGVQAALNKAAFEGDLSTLMGILKLNTWIDFYGKDGETALMKAIQGGKNFIVKALVEKGASVNLQDTAGNSSLHHLARNLNDRLTNVLETLKLNNADLEIKNKLGETPLLVAAGKLNYTGVRILMEKGAKIDAVNNEGETILFAFARQGKTKAIKELIALGVNPNIKNKKGQTIINLQNASLEFLTLK